MAADIASAVDVSKKDRYAHNPCQDRRIARHLNT